METTRICPSCHKPLPPDVPMGLCPECLIKSGFATGTEPHAPGGGFTPPAVQDIAGLFPQLEIIGFIGKGGMGAVYKARQPALDRFVALKILPPTSGNDPGFAERFNREARALARLNHPNIVAVHDFGKAGSLHYLMMEFVDGANLREIQRAGRLVPQQALSIVPQICDALQFAHGEGIVHRDIKPENILLDKKGRVKITDFGIAKIMNVGPDKAALTGARDVVGTPHYMAPEQIEKPQTVDHRADIYSLGVVFYEMLTGELPLGRFAAPSAKVQMDVRLDEVVLRALEKEPERRYQQANVLKTEVETIATGAGKSSSTSFASPPPDKISNITPPVPSRRGLPWQIWVVVAMLGLEGISNLLSIPNQPQALEWLLAKVLFITGLLMRWRPVWILCLGTAVIHVVYFLPIVPSGGIVNLILVVLIASTYRYYFDKQLNPPHVPTDASRKTLLRAAGWIAFLLWLPALALGIFFLNAILSEHGGWNPNPAEAGIVLLTLAGSLLLPAACLFLWRRASVFYLSAWTVLILGAAGAIYLQVMIKMPGPTPPVTFTSIQRPLPEAGFGPTSESVLSTSETDEEGFVFLDFESGRSYKPPFPLLVRTFDARRLSKPEFTPALNEWISTNEVDALFRLQARGWDFLPLELSCARISPDWDSPTPHDVTLAFAATEPNSVVPAATYNLPYDDTFVIRGWAFRTRNGNLGIIQCGGLKVNHPAVRIRTRTLNFKNGSPGSAVIERARLNAQEAAMASEASWLQSKNNMRLKLLLVLSALAIGVLVLITWLVVMLILGKLTAGRAVVSVFLIIIVTLGALTFLYVVSYSPPGRRNNAAIVSPDMQQFDLPVAIYSGSPGRSILLVQDKTDVHFALYSDQNFASTYMRGVSNSLEETRNIQLANGQCFELRRTLQFPYILEIAALKLHQRTNDNGTIEAQVSNVKTDGQKFVLLDGRVIVLMDDGTMEQLEIFPSRTTGDDFSQLEQLIKTKRASNQRQEQQ